MTTKDFKMEIEGVETIIKKILNKIDFPTSIIKETDIVREKIFEHKDGKHKISIKFFERKNREVYIRIIKSQKDLEYNFYVSKSIKKEKLRVNQELEIIQTVKAYKKELDLRTMF